MLIIFLQKTNKLRNKLGTKHIDPETGLIYFKYDFGYEFGIIFPGEGHKFVGGGNKINSHSGQSSSRSLPRATGSIEIPVKHERTINGNLSAIEYDSQCNSKRTKFANQSPIIDINVDEFHATDNDELKELIRKGI